MNRTAVMLALLVLAPAVAAAQEQRDDLIPPGEPKIRIGGALQYARATGEFASYVRDGAGITGHMLVRLGGHQSPLGLRVAGQFLIYGSQTRRYPLVPGISVDVTTSNNVGGFTVGPQLTLGNRSLKLYGFGAGGFSYFATTSAVEGSNSNNNPFASSTNFDDVTLAGELGAGMLVRLSEAVALDIGARYLINGNVTYVTKDGVTVSGNTLLVNPITSEANLAIYHVGVSLSLRPRRPPTPPEDDESDRRGRDRGRRDRPER